MHGLVAHWNVSLLNTGFVASLLYLPTTSGYMLGGMMIGPSGLNLIGNVVQVSRNTA